MGSERILVIDDSEVMLSRIKKALVEQGYQVTTTTRAIGNARYIPTTDLVIIDYHMPGIDGETVIQALRGSSARTPRDHSSKSPKEECLFYLHTSDTSLEQSYERLGFDGCLTDKGDEASLIRQVASIFRLRKIRAMVERTKTEHSPAADLENAGRSSSKGRGKPPGL